MTGDQILLLLLPVLAALVAILTVRLSSSYQARAASSDSKRSPVEQKPSSITPPGKASHFAPLGAAIPLGVAAAPFGVIAVGAIAAAVATKFGGPPRVITKNTIDPQNVDPEKLKATEEGIAQMLGDLMQSIPPDKNDPNEKS